MYGMEDNIREQIVEEYRDDVVTLLKYLPWLAKKSGKDVSAMYTGDGDKQVIPIPVFDSTLLAFIKDAEKTKFIDRNYPYVYSRNGIKTHEDEIRILNNCKITDLKFIKGILSKYVLGGKTKAALWAEGVDSGVFVTALECLNKLFFSNTKDGSKMIRY
ncbi:MAG: hypothetical protein Q4D29_07650 [Lachnospiraceae bacterium]|nr:hypothetical protein [Lachnospiraceae bacterium]